MQHLHLRPHRYHNAYQKQSPGPKRGKHTAGQGVTWSNIIKPSLPGLPFEHIFSFFHCICLISSGFICMSHDPYGTFFISDGFFPQLLSASSLPWGSQTMKYHVRSWSICIQIHLTRIYLESGHIHLYSTEVWPGTGETLQKFCSTHPFPFHPLPQPLILCSQTRCRRWRRFILASDTLQRLHANRQRSKIAIPSKTLAISNTIVRV